jgi:hypothetical protein
MSIESLCQDLIEVQTETATVGSSWGVSEEAAAGPSLACNVQEMSASEMTVHGIVGTDRGYMIYFPSDPGITKSNRLKWGGLYLRVDGHYSEGRPGERMLWVVIASYCSSRQESAEVA